jgi:hypothetical protein
VILVLACSFTVLSWRGRAGVVMLAGQRYGIVPRQTAAEFALDARA